MDLIWILLLVSAPIFWLYGVISFIRNLSSKKQNSNPPEENRLSLLTDIVSDLEAVRKKTQTLAQTLAKYKARLQIEQKESMPTSDLPASIVEFNSGKILTQAPTFANEVVVTQPKQPQTSLGDNLESWWQHWYKDNNINLLLYIGTFLIISSAAIFVGFNWETFSGPFKSGVLSLITLAFFVAGYFFYSQTPKLKNAGSTFLAIGSLLIPFNGLAWYNFALRGSVAFATVWFVTSIVSVLLYLALALVVKNRFYTYIAGLGGLSLVESMVSVGGLNAKFYILGGIFSSFALLAGSRLIASTKNEDFNRIYALPLSISSNVFMPIFLAWGLTVAFSTHQLFTPEVVISTFLASGYYFLSYLISKNISLFTLGELLLTLAFVLLTLTLGFSGAPVYSVIFINALIFQAASYLLRTSGRTQEGYFSVFISIFIALLGVAIAFVDPLISMEQRFYFTLIVGTLGLTASLLERIPTYLYITVIAFDSAAYLLVSQIWQRTDLFPQLGLVYVAVGGGLYLASKYLAEKGKDWSETLLFLSGINLALGVVFSAFNHDYLIFSALLIAVFASVAHYLFKTTNTLYSFLTATLVSLLALAFAYFLPEGSKEQRIYYSLIMAALAGIGSYIERQPNYLYLTLAGVDLISLTFLSEFLNLTDYFKYLGLVYLAVGVATYFVGQYLTKQAKSWSEVLLLSAAVNFGLSLILTLAYPGYALTASLVIMAVSAWSSYYYEKVEFAYAAVGFAIYSTFNLLRLLNISYDYYPIAFGVLAYLIYFLQFGLSKPKFQETLRNSGLIISVVTPIIFGIYSFGSAGLNTYPYLELSALLTAYAATGLLTIEAASTKNGSLGYAASAAGLVTILWQYHYLGINIFQVYAVTVGVYFLVLSYFKRLSGKTQDQQLFDIIGLSVLLGPLTVQAFPDSGFLYALQLGVEGLILVGYGFSSNYKTYTYAGAAAIALATVSRVYSFVASLGSWAIIGTGGLIFLAVAIFLLNSRKQE